MEAKNKSYWSWTTNCMVVMMMLYTSATLAEESVDRIVNGVLATQDQFPYLVSIQIDDFHICGGSIYNNNTIITAAHCCVPILEQDLSKVKIVAGELKLDEKSGKEQPVTVKSVNKHPNYVGDDTHLSNDICLLTLVGDLEMTDSVDQIQPASEMPEVGTMCTVAGWGKIRFVAFEGSDDLYYTTMPILEDSKCTESYDNFDKDAMICAGYTNATTDSCQGDSGGPLVCNDKLVGVVSYGVGCNFKDYAGVYTKVPTFKKWIEEETSGKSAGTPLVAIQPLIMIISILMSALDR